SCDYARRLAELNQTSRCQVAAVAHHADTTLGFAGQHGADLDALDAGSLNGSREIFGDLLVDVYDHIAVVVLDLLERHAANNSVAQRLDDLAGFNDTRNVDAVYRATIVFADDYVLCHVNQAASQVAGVRGLQSGIGQTLTSAVGRDEVLQHRQPLAEVGSDWRLDDFARRLGHQSTHAGELANLLFRSASAGVGHDVNRIDLALLVALLHLTEHLVGNLFGNGRPDFDDLVVAFTVGNGAVEILLLDIDALLLGVANQHFLVVRNHHVIDADREAGAGRVAETQLLDLIQHLDRGFQPVTQVAVAHQLSNALLLEQAIDVRHAFRKVIVQDGASDSRVQELPVVVRRVGVRDVLIVVRSGEIDHFAGVAETNRRERLNLARFEREQDFFDICERAPLTLGTRFAFGQVIKTKHHVLCRNGDRLAGRRRQDVVRGQHQYAGFDLGFRRQRDVYRHLVAVEVGVKRGANQGVDLDRLAFHQHRFERLNTEAVKRRSAVQQHRMVFNDLFQDVPNDRFLLFDHFLGLLDRRAVPGLLQPVIDKRLEQLERHLLRQPALVQLEFRTDHDDRTAGVIHALAEQVLTEPALLAFQRVGQRLQRAVVGAAQHAATTSVIEQGVNRFLQHALFVPDDDLGRVQVHQLLQPVVTVDHAAIKIIQIRGREPAAIQRNQRTQLRWNDRNHVEDHPVRLVAALPECLDHLQTLGVLEPLLKRGLVLHLLAQF